MRRALRMDVHRQARILSHQRAGGARMVHVNMRKQNGVEIVHANAVRLELLPQRLQGGARPRVNDGAVAVGFEQRRPDSVRPAHPVIVENRESAHERNSVAYVERFAIGGCRDGIRFDSFEETTKENTRTPLETFRHRPVQSPKSSHVQPAASFD